jgi:cytidylate kinase
MNIVTLSRQVGSYGDLIAAMVAEKLRLELIDRDQIHKMAQNCDPEYGELCVTYESEHGPGFFERMFFDRPSCTSMFEALTFEIASRGNVVIVGRGAQVILRDVPGVLRAKIVAPLAVRTKRVMARFNFQRAEAEDFVKRFDHQRNNLMRFIFLEDPSDWSLYDMILNTGHLTPEAATDLIVQGLNQLQPVVDVETVKEQLRNKAFAKRIQAAVRRKLTAGVARHVDVTAETSGTVRLSGRIADKKHKEKAEQVVRDYPGVTHLVNELQVTNLSFGI